MSLWVALSVAAAFLQNLRSAVQKHLTARLSTQGATATRFLYGLPFAALGLALVSLRLGTPPPPPTAAFVAYAIAGSLAQIGATASLLASFSSGGFSAGTTLSKTEGIQAVVFGYVFLGDRVSAGGLAGVALTVIGVSAVSLSRAPSVPAGEASTAPGRRRAVLLGLSAGALFALSGVCYRGAALALGDAHFLLRAGFALVFALAVQSVVMSVGLRLFEPGELTRVRRAWRAGAAAGLAGACASAGWFAAFTLANAAYVKAVGSVELVFALASAWFVFGERPSGAEIAGVLLVMTGVGLTVLLH